MTIPTPDPLALAEEAIRELEQLAAFALPHGYVMQFDAISALAAALRAAHEENARLLEEKTRLWGALGDLIDAVEDKGLSCCGCGCCCNGSKHKAMRAARDAADAALAGGKGEG